MTRNLYGIEVKREDFHQLNGMVQLLLADRSVDGWTGHYDPEEVAFATRIAINALATVREKLARMDRAKMEARTTAGSGSE